MLDTRCWMKADADPPLKERAEGKSPVNRATDALLWFLQPRSGDLALQPAPLGAGLRQPSSLPFKLLLMNLPGVHHAPLNRRGLTIARQAVCSSDHDSPGAPDAASD